MTSTKTNWLIFLVCAFLFIPFSCKKFEQITVSKSSVHDLTVGEAMAHYNKIASGKKGGNHRSATRNAGTNTTAIDFDPSPMWDAFKYKAIASGSQAVLAPLYQKNVYVGIDSNKMVGYGFLNYLMMYKDTLNNIITERVELQPSVKWLQSKTARKYDGHIIIKDIDGKVKQIMNFADGVQIFGNTSTLSAGSLRINQEPTDSMRINGDDDDCIVTTTYILTYGTKPSRCICENHLYGDPACKCPIKPTGPTTYTVDLVTTVDVVCPDDDPTNPPGGGSGGGDGPGGGNNGGGGTAPDDYPPLNCNPDPNYTVPTVPPPPGTDYVLPCSEVEIPVENPNNPPSGGEEEPLDQLSIVELIFSLQGYPLSASEKLFLSNNSVILNDLIGFLSNENPSIIPFLHWGIAATSTSHISWDFFTIWLNSIDEEEFILGVVNIPTIVNGQNVPPPDPQYTEPILIIKPVANAVIRGIGTATPIAPATMKKNLDGSINSDAYNCHTYAWNIVNADETDHGYDARWPKWDNDPSNNTSGYHPILSTDTPKQIGDRVLYYNFVHNVLVITHSGVVSQVDANGQPTEITSKWGQEGVYKHHPQDVPPSYGSGSVVCSNLVCGYTKVYYRKD